MSARHDPAIDAEQALLGALLLDATARQRIGELRGEHFGTDLHRAIFAAILDEDEDSGAPDLVTVGERLQRNGKVNGDGLAYLGTLAQNTPGTANAAHYAELVRDGAQRRALAAIGVEIAKRASAPGFNADEVRRDALARLASTKPASRVCATLDWTALAASQAPPRRWAVNGWLGYGHVSLLVGVGGIGKSLVAQQLSSCLALGRAFIDEVPAAAKVLAWHCEDDADELWRRQEHISRWLQVGLDAFAGTLVVVPRHGRENALVVSEYGKTMFTPLIEELREQAEDYRAEVVVLDNVAQLYGGSENDRGTVTRFMNALVGTLPGRAVLLLAHPARAAGSEFSGSSAWENVARTRLYLGTKLPDQKPDPDEEPDEETRYLSRRKANYSAKDWRRFTYRDNVLVPDPVEPGGGIMAHLTGKAAERVVLDGLRKLREMGLVPTDGHTSPRWLPRLLAEYRLNDGKGKRELAQAMRRMMVEGRLRRCPVGTDERRHPVIGLVIDDAPTSAPTSAPTTR